MTGPFAWGVHRPFDNPTFLVSAGTSDDGAETRLRAVSGKLFRGTDRAALGTYIVQHFRWLDVGKADGTEFLYY
ncbi:hypothetical protein [uncultured Pseudacidovorax sp.]|uniref:hypothetical protein n=1 Tax=uncultured Pseudacidovorax sp. TaxID=679313 RepID=UPI0025F6B369|nr:hypothetical protein [uncultured Pseudacidovorax sp.]